MFKTCGIFFLMMIMGPMAWAEEPPSLAPTGMAALRAQMEVERAKEQELQLLQLEVDRLKLEVEKKKAVVELGKINGAGREDGLSAVPDGQPSVSLRYVFIAPGRKEAVLDVDGVAHRVQEGNDVGGRLVKGISVEGVSLKTKDGLEFFLRPGA
jgi:hypothetical protein